MVVFASHLAGFYQFSDLYTLLCKVQLRNQTLSPLPSFLPSHVSVVHGQSFKGGEASADSLTQQPSRQAIVLIAIENTLPVQYHSAPCTPARCGLNPAKTA